MDKIYKKNEDFVYRKIAGETLLVPIRRAIKELQSIYSLNDTACFIWEKLDGKRTVAEIADILESGYQTDKNVLETDLKEFIEKLKAIGAVECLS